MTTFHPTDARKPPGRPRGVAPGGLLLLLLAGLAVAAGALFTNATRLDGRLDYADRLTAVRQLDLSPAYEDFPRALVALEATTPAEGLADEHRALVDQVSGVVSLSDTMALGGPQAARVEAVTDGALALADASG